MIHRPFHPNATYYAPSKKLIILWTNRHFCTPSAKHFHWPMSWLSETPKYYYWNTARGNHLKNWYLMSMMKCLGKTVLMKPAPTYVKQFIISSDFSLNPLLVVHYVRLARNNVFEHTYWVTLFSIAEIKEYCTDERFQSSCADDEVMIIQYAKYGRMKLGNCLTGNFGFIGKNIDKFSINKF